MNLNEYSNMITQMTQQQSTKKESIEEHIANFQYKNWKKTYTQGMEHVKQFQKENNNHNLSSGYTDALLLTLIIAFAIGMAVGIGYMLHRISIGG